MALKPLRLRIEAVDRFTKRINAFSKKIRETTGPINKMRRSLRDAARASGLSSLVGGVRSLVGWLVQAAQRAALFASGLAIAGAFAFRKVANIGDSIAKAADKLGLGTEAFQELQFAAERAGVPQEAFRMGLQRLIRRLGEFRVTGKGEAAPTLQALGIAGDITNGKLRNTEEILEAIADRMAQVKDQQIRLSLTQKLFDSEGVVFVNLLQQGSEEMRRLRGQARELGVVISDDAVRALETASDAMTDLRAISAGLALSIGGAIAPAVTRLITKINAWVVTNRTLISTKIDAFATNVNTALEGIIKSAPKAAKEFTKFWKDAGPGIKQIARDLTDVLHATAELIRLYLKNRDVLRLFNPATLGSDAAKSVRARITGSGRGGGIAGAAFSLLTGSGGLDIGRAVSNSLGDLFQRPQARTQGDTPRVILGLAPEAAALLRPQASSPFSGIQIDYRVGNALSLQP